MVRAEFERVHADVLSLEKDIYAWWSASASMGAEEQAKRDRFKEAWRLFADEWKEYRSSALAGLGTGWGGHVDRVQKYGQDVTRWRDAFTKEGGAPTGPGPRPPEPGFPWAKSIIAGIITAGLVIGVPRAIKAYHESKRGRGF
jgi:hypothetical protein